MSPSLPPLAGLVPRLALGLSFPRGRIRTRSGREQSRLPPGPRLGPSSWDNLRPSLSAAGVLGRAPGPPRPARRPRLRRSGSGCRRVRTPAAAAAAAVFSLLMVNPGSGSRVCLVWARLEPSPSHLLAALLSGGNSWFKNSLLAIGQPCRFTVGLEEPRRRQASSISEASDFQCNSAFVRVFGAAVPARARGRWDLITQHPQLLTQSLTHSRCSRQVARMVIGWVFIIY